MGFTVGQRSTSKNINRSMQNSRRGLVAQSISVGVLGMLYAVVASGNGFWANKNGGGLDDVIIDTILYDDYEQPSTTDEVEFEVTDQGLSYDIEVSTDSLIVFSEPLDQNSIILKGDQGEQALLIPTEPDTEDFAADSFIVPKGAWTLTIPDEALTKTSLVTRSLVASTTKDLVDEEPLTAVVDSRESLYSLVTSVDEETKTYGKYVYVSAHLSDNTAAAGYAEATIGRVLRGNGTHLSGVTISWRD